MSRSRSQTARAHEVRVIDAVDQAQVIRAEWLELARSCQGGPFTLPGLALPWWRHLGRGHLRIVTVRNGAGDLIGLAPLFERHRGPVTVVGLLGTGVGAVGEFLVAPSKSDVVGSLLQAALGDGRTALDLINVRYGDALIASLRRNRELLTRAELQDECPIVTLDGHESVDSLLARPSRAGLRKKLAKATRSLSGHSVDFQTSKGPEEVATAWKAVQPLYDRAEKDQPRQHFGQGLEGEFFADALAALAAVDAVSITTMAIDGDLAAFDVFVHNGGTASAVLGRMDPSLAEFSPGQLLLRYGVDEAIAARERVVDLQLGDDLYKRRWADDAYDTVHVRAATTRNFTLADGVLRGVDAGFALRTRLHR